MLERYIETGFLFDRLLHVARVIPITFDRDTIIIGDVRMGVMGYPLSLETIEGALDTAYYRIAKKTVEDENVSRQSQ